MKKLILLSILLTSLGSIKIQAQNWNWECSRPNSGDLPDVERYIWGAIQKMKTNGDCSKWNYGKSQYQKITIYSYSKTSNAYSLKFKFYWQIDYMFGGSSSFSYTIKLDVNHGGCSARITYVDETGGPSCNYNINEFRRVDCVY